MAEGVVFPFPSLPLNEGRTYGPVSYTHLDVYKRQALALEQPMTSVR